MNALDFYDQVEHAIVTPMFTWLLDGRTPQVLDVGCGRGVHASLFAEAGCKVTDIDDDARHRTAEKDQRADHGEHAEDEEDNRRGAPLIMRRRTRERHPRIRW